MKIAIMGLRSIGPSAAGGIEKAIEALGTRFARSGHDVTVFCRTRYSEIEGQFYRGVRVRSVPAIYTKHLEAISNTVLAILYTLRGYDVVHINATGPALLSFLPRLFRTKVVVTVHGLDWKREKWGIFAKWVLRLGAWASVTFPDETIVVSRTLQAHYRDTYGKTVTYIPNGVDLPEGSAVFSLTELGLVEDGYVLFLSRLVPEKGCHTLIKAFRGLDTDKKLVIVGAPSHSEDYAAELRNLAKGDPRVVFTGPLFGPAKDAIYRGAYCFVLPSTIEGMALVLLEAMSYGKCCLCSDIDENVEVITREDRPRPSSELLHPIAEQPSLESSVAFTFRTGDSGHLRQQLQFLLASPEAVSSTGQAARQHVSSSFSWDRIATDYLALFAESSRTTRP